LTNWVIVAEVSISTVALAPKFGGGCAYAGIQVSPVKRCQAYGTRGGEAASKVRINARTVADATPPR
jgi:hypothetical protein